MNKIGWCDFTLNPFKGCSAVSDGCRSCYAAQQAIRMVRLGDARYDGLAVRKDNGRAVFTGKVVFDITAMEPALRRKKPATYFLCSMSDVFHEENSFDQIDQVFAAMALCPQHTFKVLTKRPARMLKYANYLQEQIGWWGISAKELFGIELPESSCAFPLDNVQLGVSVENQATADERIPLLLRTPAAYRFVSLEPMLGEVSIWHHRDWMGSIGISQVIIGCESGKNRRPCPIEWVESVVEQCTVAGVAVWVKQLDIGGKVVKDINQFPKHLQRREF